MGCLEQHGRLLLYICFTFSVFAMAGDFVYNVDDMENFVMGEFQPSLLFYLLSNAILMYRVFGFNWFSCLLHILMMIGTFLIIFLNQSILGETNSLITLTVLGIQGVFALCLTLPRSGFSVVERAFRVGIHALYGFMASIYVWWVCVWLTRVKKPFYYIGMISAMLYLLLYLFMILTPSCQAPSQTGAKADRIQEAAQNRIQIQRDEREQIEREKLEQVQMKLRR